MNTNNTKPVWSYLLFGILMWAAYFRKSSNLLGSNPLEYKCTCGKTLNTHEIKWHPTEKHHIGGDRFIFGTCKYCKSTHPIRRELLVGGRGDYIPDSAFDGKKLEKGIKHELEHTKSRKVAKEIAKDHLVEDADYYEKLDKIEKKSNPSGRCLYTMEIAYRRGGQLNKKSMMAEAYTMTEARSKFQNIINKNLRDATLESLHVEKSSC